MDKSQHPDSWWSSFCLIKNLFIYLIPVLVLEFLE
jgi:hypothetical protein